MTSEKQIQANTYNALKGGVKTPEGKAIVRYNALKHGLLSKELLLKNESEQELEKLNKTIRSEFKPKNALELILIERIIANVWRLRRLLKAEREMIEHDMDDNKNFGSALSYDFANYDSYGKFTRYETCIERGIYRALHELQRLRPEGSDQKPILPIVIDVDTPSNN